MGPSCIRLHAPRTTKPQESSLFLKAEEKCKTTLNISKYNFETLRDVTTVPLSGFEWNLNPGEDTSTISCNPQRQEGAAARLGKRKQER